MHDGITYVTSRIDPGVVDGAGVLASSFIHLAQKLDLLIKVVSLVVDRGDGWEKS